MPTDNREDTTKQNVYKDSPTSNKPRDTPHWLTYAAAWVGLALSIINIGILCNNSKRTNTLFDYVVVANFNIKPRSFVYKTYTDDEWLKIHWDHDPTDVQSDGTHKFTYFFSVFDSTQNRFILEHFSYYQFAQLHNILDTSLSVKGDHFLIEKVYEPKFSIKNIGASPAIDMAFKVGLKQSDKTESSWRQCFQTIEKQNVAGGDSVFPTIQLRLPYDAILKDTVYFRILIHFENIMNKKIDSNYYFAWEPSSDKWFFGDYLRTKFGLQPFNDEIKQK